VTRRLTSVTIVSVRTYAEAPGPNILHEALVRADGLRIGPVGGRIVGEVFVNNLRNDPNSYLNVDPSWEPIAGGGSSFQMTNFLTYARVDPASRGQ
jgi:hypothetical protein